MRDQQSALRGSFGTHSPGISFPWEDACDCSPTQVNGSAKEGTEHMAARQTRQPTLNSIAPYFAVGNLEQALAFYGQLGFAPTYQYEGFVIVERDGIDLHLNSSEEPPKRHSVCWIGVTNIEALYHEYLPTNAISSPLVAKSWGLKEFSVRDPFGNLILFAEGISEEASAEPEG